MTRTKQPNGNGKEKRGRGRPSEYAPEYTDQAYKLCLLRATDYELADFFGKSEVTINAWKNRYPEFLNALKEGKIAADMNVAKSLYKKAVGYDYTEQKAIKVKTGQYTEKVELVDVIVHVPAETSAINSWLNNRQSDKWKDRRFVKTEVSGPDGGPISIAHKIDLSDLSEEELLLVKKMGLTNGDA